ncbi:hypothetical protein MPLB_1680131 [Mesorhizobium sp. ORS 3324]|nr:hypothetical protein MPLB_1680131 [Mesorhizobium sp. ORS 3324]
MNETIAREVVAMLVNETGSSIPNFNVSYESVWPGNQA